MTINIKELSRKDIGRAVNYLRRGKKKPDLGTIVSYDEDYICVNFPLKRTDEIYSYLLKQNLLSAYEEENKGGIWISFDELQFVYGQRDLFFNNLN